MWTSKKHNYAQVLKELVTFAFCLAVCATSFGTLQLDAQELPERLLKSQLGIYSELHSVKVSEAEEQLAFAVPVIPSDDVSEDDPASEESRRNRRIDGTISAPSGDSETVVLVAADDYQTTVTAAREFGARLLRATTYPSLDLTLAVFDLRNRISPTTFQQELQALSIPIISDEHVVYRFAQGAAPRTYAGTLIGGSSTQSCRVRRPISIGLIDGPVNVGHPALSGAKIVVENVARPDALLAGPSHGTGIATLIAGDDPAGILDGFAKGVTIYSMTTFSQEQGREYAPVENIIAAMERLIRRKVSIINMSFVGPRNRVLDRLIEIADKRGIVMVAAVGNGGVEKESYPAAAPEVIAVTAVDAAKRLYRQANRGEHIDLSAPGVDIYAAKFRGAGYVSGTSFAAPIVTAVTARLVANGVRSPDAVRRTLINDATDLGDPGHDPEFGWGLVNARGC